MAVLGNPAVAFETYPDTPKWSGLVYANIEVPLTNRIKVQVRGDVYAQTSTFFSSTGTNLNPLSRFPGYSVANFRLGIEDEKAGWSLATIVKNAFDKVYYVGGVAFSSLFAVNTAVPGEPRTVMMEAKFKF